jgi:hypothetical protein
VVCANLARNNRAVHIKQPVCFSVISTLCSSVRLADAPTRLRSSCGPSRRTGSGVIHHLDRPSLVWHSIVSLKRPGMDHILVYHSMSPPQALGRHDTILVYHSMSPNTGVASTAGLRPLVARVRVRMSHCSPPPIARVRVRMSRNASLQKG